ncbi:histidine phosphatase family protein [Pyruvatibacter mobilis]|uniref:histidine phosphatase family protein n=1 Tax=Pyruvatibacter mobilis TaxID=1712261 RepID=UPI003BA8B309
MTMSPRIAFDGALRRRVYLFRHGDVAYVSNDGSIVADPRQVHLTRQGQEEADAMGRMMADVPVDKAVCSGLPRTRQTLARILGDRDLPVEEVPDLEELRSDRAQAAYEQGGAPDPVPLPDDLSEVAYAFLNAHEPGMRYRNGEVFADFEGRVVPAFEGLLKVPGWHNMALVAHGGVNRVLLGWALGTGLKTFGQFEQDTCCLNVLDIDQDPDSLAVRRVLVRAVNATTYDPPKRDRHLTTLEGLAHRLQEARQG